MTKLRYTLICEGKDVNVLPILIKKIGTNIKKEFIHDKQIKISGSSQSSKGKILKELEKLVQASYAKGDINLFIVGVDLDGVDHTGESHKRQIQELCSKIPKVIQDSKKMKIVCFSPVQAIEAWLAYQQKDSIPAHSLEKKSPKTLKEDLYGSNRVNSKIAEELAEKTDVNLLRKQSKSFDHFYKQFESPKTKQKA